MLKRILITAVLFFVSSLHAASYFSASYCEKAVEKYALEHFSKLRYGKEKAKARSVSIRALVTSVVIEGERYRTTGQAHVTYKGSTGGEVSEVKYFEGVIEDGEDRPSFIKFEEVKEKR